MKIEFIEPQADLVLSKLRRPFAHDLSGTQQVGRNKRSAVKAAVRY